MALAVTPTLPELYLAYRQAKTALFYERSGVGLLGLAKFEHDLPSNLAGLRSQLAKSDWFDGVDLGDPSVVPKRLHREGGNSADLTRIGTPRRTKDREAVEVQLRLSPTPAFATLEVLYLWRFGAALDALLSRSVLGYRLDLRHRRVVPHRRWLFEYWPRRYQEFRTTPLQAARKALGDGDSVFVISCDLASFYDTIDPSFLISEPFLQTITGNCDDPDGYQRATCSLLRGYLRYREEASRRAGTVINSGVPIGALTSRVVANVALAPLDAYIAERPNILCYRRYVDDIVIVAKATEGHRNLEEILRRFFPLRAQKDEIFHLDVDVLGRSGCTFQLQKAKVKVHELQGVPGLDFIEAVAADFGKLVSERRAFVDAATLLEGGAAHLIRAGEAAGSPLRVLRSADRTRLERFALSTSLHSLERVSTLVGQEAAREVIRQNLERIARVLDSEDDWVDNLDITLRLLKVAISCGDWESCDELNEYMERTWGTVENLQLSATELRYRGVSIDPQRTRPWASLRNYLHERRLEAVCSVLPAAATQRELRQWLPHGGLRVGTSSIGAVGLRRRVQSLAAADLRSRDREDDGESRGAEFTFDWMRAELGDDPDLQSRLVIIEKFVQRCRQLGDDSWLLPPARLFLCTRPPSYFDIARRWLYRVETDGFETDVFERLLLVVNAVRGTDYQDSVGGVVGRFEVEIPDHFPRERAGEPIEAPNETCPQIDPRIILGNLVVDEANWIGAATRASGSTVGMPVLHPARLLSVNRVLARAEHVARGQRTAVLLLPELSLPRKWFRAVANHVVGLGGFGLVAGLEYLHDVAHPYVHNQTFAVFPGPYKSAASWPWTKRIPAREEATLLAGLPTPLSFPPPGSDRAPRTIVKSPWGSFSVLICSELLEARRVADLLGRVELVLCPAWNRDTASYDHLIQSVGFQLHSIIAIANNGEYSDCRVWAPRKERWERELCRLIERGVNDIVYVDIPLTSLVAFHASHGRNDTGWRPLPPDYP